MPPLRHLTSPRQSLTRPQSPVLPSRSNELAVSYKIRISSQVCVTLIPNQGLRGLLLGKQDSFERHFHIRFLPRGPTPNLRETRSASAQGRRLARASRTRVA